MSRRNWLVFALALAMVAGTGLGIGFWHHQRNDPRPLRWLTADSTVTVRGSEFSLSHFDVGEPVIELDYELPPGGQVAVLTLEQQVHALPPSDGALFCNLTLVTDSAQWTTHYELGYELGITTTCEAESVGETRTINAVWLVPPGVLEDNPRVVVEFNSPRGSFGVRPLDR